MTNEPIKEITAQEQEFILRLRELKPYQKLEVKLFHNQPGKIVFHLISNERKVYGI